MKTPDNTPTNTGSAGGTADAPARDKSAPAAVDISEESVAGEEDPGAALDLLRPPPPPAR